MKKKLTQIVKAVPASTRVVTKVYCDVPGCNDEIKQHTYGWGKVGHQCIICKRDICKRHTVEDPQDPGDYPDRWCTVCHPLYYRARDEMYARHEREEQALIRKVKKESLEK